MTLEDKRDLKELFEAKLAQVTSQISDLRNIIERHESNRQQSENRHCEQVNELYGENKKINEELQKGLASLRDKFYDETRNIQEKVAAIDRRLEVIENIKDDYQDRSKQSKANWIGIVGMFVAAASIIVAAIVQMSLR